MAEENQEVVVGEQETPEVIESERPEWLQEKFATPEDQAKAYGEAERRLQEKSQEAAEYRNYIETLRAQSAPIHQEPPEETGQAELDTNEFFTDPSAVLNRRDVHLLEQAKKQVLADVMPVIESIAESRVDQAIYEYQNQWGEELPEEAVTYAKEMLKNVPLNQRTNPQVIQAVVDTSMGSYQRGQRLKQRPVAAGSQRMVQAWNLSESRSGKQVVPTAQPISQVERTAMQGLGLTEKEWLDHKAALAAQPEEEERG